MKRLFSISLLLALGVAISVRAQSNPTTGEVTGTVLTADGKPAADCIVTLQQNAQKMRLPLSATTDSDGKFTIEKVPEGDYNLNARTRDAKGRAIKSLSVVAGKTTDIGKLRLRSS
jgi:5-hydroxyisourate hydrolase-like protein (transthyretin family)